MKPRVTDADVAAEVKVLTWCQNHPDEQEFIQNLTTAFNADERASYNKGCVEGFVVAGLLGALGAMITVGYIAYKDYKKKKSTNQTL